MDIFSLFRVFLDFVIGLAMFLTGRFLWKNFKDDFEAKTIGGVFMLASIIFFLMFFRVLALDLGWINKDLAIWAFFVEYIVIAFLTFSFAFPRFFCLVFNTTLAKKIALILGNILFLIYLIIHFNQKENIISEYTIYGLLFNIPFVEKIFLVIIFGLLLPIMCYRAGINFIQWRRKKSSPYKFLQYLFLFLIAGVSIIYFLPYFEAWWFSLSGILSIGGVLGVYLLASQELMEKEEKS